MLSLYFRYTLCFDGIRVRILYFRIRLEFYFGARVRIIVLFLSWRPASPPGRTGSPGNPDGPPAILRSAEAVSQALGLTQTQEHSSGRPLILSVPDGNRDLDLRDGCPTPDLPERWPARAGLRSKLGSVK